MPQITLTPAQRKVHRADAHHLDPVVHIGNDGLSPAVKKEIEDELDRGLPDSYGVIAYKEKCNTVFQHIYDSYAGDNHSIYEAVA